MEIFITGATGYIGLAVAQAFRRAGHRVSGLARGAEGARTLMRHEVAPVLGTLAETGRYREAAARADVIVHAAIDYTADTGGLDRQVVEGLLEIAAGAPRAKAVIYTSGAWVYGDTGDGAADEAAPLRPTAAVAWRPAVERLVLEAPGLRGVVIRPGAVYGGRGGLTGAWLSGATEGDLRVVGDGANRWAMVHVDDLADAYLRAAEAGVAQEVLNIADGAALSVGELARAAAAAAGYAGPIRHTPLAEARATLGALADALALDQRLSSAKAARLLGWRPRHPGFADAATTYYAAWRAAQGDRARAEA